MANSSERECFSVLTTDVSAWNLGDKPTTPVTIQRHECDATAAFEGKKRNTTGQSVANSPESQRSHGPRLSLDVSCLALPNTARRAVLQ